MMEHALHVHLVYDERRQMQVISQKGFRRRTAVGFLVHEVPPAADHLANDQRRRANIGDTPEIIAPSAHHNDRAYNRANKRAVYRYAAFPNFEDVP